MIGNEKILEVDLSLGKFKEKDVPKEIIKKYIGGKGVGTRLLFDRAKPKTDPLGPNNLLIFATGPLTGLNISGGEKLAVIFKSPQTNIFGESYCGGYFAPQFKRTGYDFIVIKGIAKKPVYLFVNDNTVEIKKADHLWTKDTFETEKILKEDHGKIFQVASIGPAGENLVKYACITHAEGFLLGRAGVGTVMGSKKLKAVVVHGTKKIEIKKQQEIEAFKKDLNEKLNDRGILLDGTPETLMMTHYMGALPTRNWTEGEFEGAEQINLDRMKEKIIVKKRSCQACVVACKNISEIKKGPYAGTHVSGPEYETLFSLGALCGNSNLESIAKANELCNRLGMDTISAGNVIAFGMECYSKGFLTKKELDDVDLKFGNHEAIITMINKIAYRKGIGDIFAEGVKNASEKIKGSQTLAVHAKGLELPGYDPRATPEMALSYVTSDRGGCHLRSIAYRPDMMEMDGKVEMVKDLEDYYSVCDSMILCRLVTYPVMGPIYWENLAELYSMVTEKTITKDDLVTTGERINNLCRWFNVREGITRKDDYLPNRFSIEPLKKGQYDGMVLNKENFDMMLDEYYKLRKWDNNGIPPKENI
jgi:aldehyde:ferredoxin oxidoreductase